MVGCLRIRNHCPPTDDFVQLLCQSSLPASKDACAAFPCTSPKSPGGGCVAVPARRFVPRVPWKGCVEYWMYFQALYRVLWGKSLSQNQCFLIWRQPWSEARRFVPRVPWKGCVEYWMYFQALYRVLWGKSLSQNQCFLIWRQPWSEVRFSLAFLSKTAAAKGPRSPLYQGNGGHLHLHLTTGYRSARYSRH